jgi:hypothetical protein
VALFLCGEGGVADECEALNNGTHDPGYIWRTEKPEEIQELVV